MSVILENLKRKLTKNNIKFEDSKYTADMIYILFRNTRLYFCTATTQRDPKDKFKSVSVLLSFINPFPEVEKTFYFSDEAFQCIKNSMEDERATECWHKHIGITSEFDMHLREMSRILCCHFISRFAWYIYANEIYVMHSNGMVICSIKYDYVISRYCIDFYSPFKYDGDDLEDHVTCKSADTACTIIDSAVNAYDNKTIINEYEKNEVENMDEKIKARVRGLESLQFDLQRHGIESTLHNASDPILYVIYPTKAKYTFCSVKEISEPNDFRYKYDVNVVWPFKKCVAANSQYYKSMLIDTLSKWLSLEYVEIFKSALLLLQASTDDYDTAYEEMKGVKKIKSTGAYRYADFESKAYDAKLIGTGSYSTWCCGSIARYSAGADRIIKDVIFNDPATIVFWYDGSKTIVKARNEKFDPEKGLAMAISKKFLGNEYSYYEFFNKYVGKYNKKLNKKESLTDTCKKAQNKVLSNIVLNTAKNLRAEGASLSEIAKIMGYDDPAAIRSILPDEEESKNEVQ